MSEEPEAQGAAFLKEFQDFATFLQHLWGVLAGISILFPLSNVFVKVLPLESFDNGGALVWFSRSLFTTAATLVSLFIVVWTFGQRGKLSSPVERRRLQRRAWISFGLGLTALILYLAAYYFIATSVFDVFGWESSDIRRLLGEIPLLVLYGAFFALLTRAFVLQAMIEFFRKRLPQPSAA